MVYEFSACTQAASQGTWVVVEAGHCTAAQVCMHVDRCVVVLSVRAAVVVVSLPRSHGFSAEPGP